MSYPLREQSGDSAFNRGEPYHPSFDGVTNAELLGESPLHYSRAEVAGTPGARPELTVNTPHLVQHTNFPLPPLPSPWQELTQQAFDASYQNAHGSQSPYHPRSASVAGGGFTPYDREGSITPRAQQHQGHRERRTPAWNTQTYGVQEPYYRQLAPTPGWDTEAYDAQTAPTPSLEGSMAVDTEESAAQTQAPHAQGTHRLPAPLETCSHGNGYLHRSYVFTTLCGIRTDLVSEPTRGGGRGAYQCPRCEKAFSRQFTVKAHFARCVQEHGNPDALRWFDHASLDGHRPQGTWIHPATGVAMSRERQPVAEAEAEEKMEIKEEEEENRHPIPSGEQGDPYTTAFDPDAFVLDIDPHPRLYFRIKNAHGPDRIIPSNHAMWGERAVARAPAPRVHARRIPPGYVCTPPLFSPETFSDGHVPTPGRDRMSGPPERYGYGFGGPCSGEETRLEGYEYD